MKIRDFAERMGLSDSTVRYYERIGVLPTVGRLKNGYREFDEQDVDWMDFVIRLRNTGMPMARIVEFSKLRELGDATLTRRAVILEEHETQLVREMKERSKSLQKLREKLALYRKP